MVRCKIGRAIKRQHKEQRAHAAKPEGFGVFKHRFTFYIVGFYGAGIALALLCAFSMTIVLKLERWLPRRKRYLFELSF